MTDQNLSDLIHQGRRCLDRGDFRRAIAHFEQAAAQAREWGEGENELIALGWLPSAWGSLSDHHHEVEAATRLLTRARELQREDYELIATLRLAEAVADLDLRGHWRELKPLLLQGLETSQRLGKTWYEVYHMMLLGHYAVRAGDDDEGETWLKQALYALHPTIEHNTVPRCLFRLNIYSAYSTLMRRRGTMAEALRYAEMAVGVARDERNPAFVAEAQITMVKARHASGDHAAALNLLDELLPRARQQGWKGVEREAEYLLGIIERESGQLDSAEVAARRALDLSRELKLREEEVPCLLSLGHTLLAQQRTDEATETLTQARRLAQERDYADYFEQAERLLEEI